MIFNKKISGFQNEEEFASYLNGKKVKMVNPIFLEFFSALFINIEEDDVIKCWVSYERKKEDIYIKIKDNLKRISIKKGVKNSVHAEKIDSFCKFLQENGIKKKYIKEILLYHYADGTINGTGNKRLTTAKYKVGKDKKLLKINSYLNNEKFIDLAIERFVTKGNNSDIEIDAIIYGVVNDFIWITKEEIKYIIKKRKDILSTSLHFGSLYYQPMNRNIIGNPKYEDKRNYIQIKWYNISDDIIEVMATYRKNIFIDKDNNIIKIK